jgi:hypothetical protein
VSIQISRLISETREISGKVQKTFGKLSVKQMNWKPGESEWSIAQCLEHLIITNDLYFENIQRVADGTHQNNIFSRIPFVPKITGSIMKKVLAPEWGWKMKTLKMFKPSFSKVAEDILEKFGENQNRFISLMEAAKELETEKIRVAEPIGRAVNLRLSDAFEILVVHEKRHFEQAKRVLEMKDFPV